MNLVIPPLFFYAVGAVLVIAGAARSLTLGRRRPARDDIQAEPAGPGDDPASSTAPTKAAQVRRRHMIFGIVWMALGLFLILSTAGVLRSRFPGG